MDDALKNKFETVTEDECKFICNAALNTLVGYPHRMPDELQAMTGMTREEIKELFVRWKRTGKDVSNIQVVAS